MTRCNGETAGPTPKRTMSVADRLLTLAQRTPAWTELHLRLLDGLAGTAPGSHATATIDSARRAVAELSEACPQVVDLDAPGIMIRRAEWRDGSLFVTIDAAEPDPTKLTTFRLVGAEPRLWYLTGISGATTDVGQHSMVVLLPAVSGELAFVPGSY